MNIKDDILNDKQQGYINVFYSFDDMSLSMNKGSRYYQEDSGLIFTHPINNNCRIIAVADGIGGAVCGDRASYIAILKLLKWFISLSEKQLRHEENMISELYQLINDIDNEIIRNFRDESGTTLVFALELEKNLYFYSIGDSKLIILKNNNIVYESIEDSEAMKQYLRGKIDNKDDVRFHHYNSIVTDYIGYYRLDKINYGINAIKKDSYDKLLLFTDGVSDILATNEVLRINSNNAQDYVDSAMNLELVNMLLDDKKYFNKIKGGEDNTTAAVLIKK